MKAFLSYSSRDKGTVEAVADELGAANVELDSQTFDRGILNVTAIQNALKRADLYVLFLTKDALESRIVRYEALLAQELFAQGIVERFLVVCLDEEAFASAEQQWKAFNFVRRALGVQSIVRLIQHDLIAIRAKQKGGKHPFVGRTTELHDAKEQLIDPQSSKMRGLYISGYTGIGRHTFARHLFRDVYPAVLSVFPEITIERLDGYEEIYRKLSERLSPFATLSAWRARVAGFAAADENGKVDLIIQLLKNLMEAREAIFVTDTGGLLDGDGGFQVPLKKTISRMQPQNRPSVIFIAQRMVKFGRRKEVTGIVYCSLPSLMPDDIRQLIGFLLRDADIAYTSEELNRLVQLCEGHPFNAHFLIEAIKEYTLPVVLGDPSDITKWKRRRANEFLQDLTFSDEEKKIVGTLRDFTALDFATLSQALGTKIDEVSKAMSRLMDYHLVETLADTFLIAPPMRDAVDRDPRFDLAPDQHRRVLRAISDQLIAANDDTTVSMSMVEAGVLATLQEGKELPDLFSAFLLPSHLVWLARRWYDQKNNIEAIRLARSALGGRERLSPAGKVEACRILCLAAARRAQDDEFRFGIQILKSIAGEPWSRSNLNFLLGFNARMHGNLPEAEKYFRLAYEDSPRNFSAARELAAICLLRDNDDAEKFAREAFDIAPDNPYLLDILLSVLIRSDRARVEKAQSEIDGLFARLQAGEELGRSFYTTRRAEYELRWGSLDEACKLIDDAVTQSPTIFNVHALRAQIYLERGNHSIAHDELKKLYAMVYRDKTGERLTNLRAYLVLEASYYAATGDFRRAKAIYTNRNVFTEQEGLAETRKLETEEAYKRK
jgi:Flp pilus assembly protein TadD